MSSDSVTHRVASLADLSIHDARYEATALLLGVALLGLAVLADSGVAGVSGYLLVLFGAGIRTIRLLWDDLREVVR